jgi:hypothetical protein
MGSIFIIQQLLGTHTKSETQTHISKKASDSVLSNNLQETVMNWGILSHLMGLVQSQHHDARIRTRKENKQGKVLEEINK